MGKNKKMDLDSLTKMKKNLSAVILNLNLTKYKITDVLLQYY